MKKLDTVIEFRRKFALSYLFFHVLTEWLTTLDKRVSRNILLLIDNCTAHKIHVNLNTIKIVYLPANTTSLLQPCDHGEGGG